MSPAAYSAFVRLLNGWRRRMNERRTYKGQGCKTPLCKTVEKLKKIHSFSQDTTENGSTENKILGVGQFSDNSSVIRQNSSMWPESTNNISTIWMHTHLFPLASIDTIYLNWLQKRFGLPVRHGYDDNYRSVASSSGKNVVIITR